MIHRLISPLALLSLAAVLTGCSTDKNILAEDGTSYVQCGAQRLRVHVSVDPAGVAGQAPAPAPTVNTQQFAALQEQNRALQARIQELNLAVQDRDRSLAQTNSEVLAASQEVARARQELQRLRQNNAELRDRLTASEKENLRTLQSVVSSLEQGVQPANPAPGASPSAR